MKRKTTLFSASVTGLILASVQACSPLAARKPEPNKLSVPQNKSGTGFGLSGETPSGLYRGGLLIWNKDVKPNQIRDLLQANRETNEKYVALNRYFNEFVEKEVRPLRETLATKQKQYSLNKSESDRRLAPLQKQKAAAWYEQATVAVLAQFPEFDKARMDGIFSAYCDAKILDLATRPFVQTGQFQTRPTPSALCESYYQGRYFSGELCADAPSGKNYYDCLVNEGVLRTRFAERLQVRVASRRTGTRTSEAMSLADFFKSDLVKSALALNDVPFCTSSEVRRSLLSGVRYRQLSSGVILGGLGCGENSRFEISYGPGDWDKELASASAAVIVDGIEVAQGGTSLPTSFQWVEPTIAASNRALATRVQGMASKLALFHASSANCGSEFASPNDIFFNEGRLLRAQGVQGHCKSQMPPAGSLPEVVVFDEELETQRLSLQRMEGELQTLKGNSCPVAPSCEGVAPGHARCDFLNAQVRKAAAAEVRGVASVLVTDFGLSFERVGAASSSVVLWMNGAAIGVGCVGENKLGACTGALVKPELASAQPVLAEVSRDSELVLKIKIDSRQLAAAGVPESVVKQFQPFNENILELNATSNSMEGIVPYLSGKAFIRPEASSESILAEGSVSYLIENSFDKSLGEFCSAN